MISLIGKLDLPNDYDISGGFPSSMSIHPLSESDPDEIDRENINANGCFSMNINNKIVIYVWIQVDINDQGVFYVTDKFIFKTQRDADKAMKLAGALSSHYHVVEKAYDDVGRKRKRTK